MRGPTFSILRDWFFHILPQVLTFLLPSSCPPSCFVCRQDGETDRQGTGSPEGVFNRRLVGNWLVGGANELRVILGLVSETSVCCEPVGSHSAMSLSCRNCRSENVHRSHLRFYDWPWWVLFIPVTFSESCRSLIMDEWRCRDRSLHPVPTII